MLNKSKLLIVVTALPHYGVSSILRAPANRLWVSFFQILDPDLSSEFWSHIYLINYWAFALGYPTDICTCYVSNWTKDVHHPYSYPVNIYSPAVFSINDDEDDGDDERVCVSNQSHDQPNLKSLNSEEYTL